MSRLNGRLASAPPQDPNQGFEPSCLVRTPSGNVYIPSGTLNHSKNSVIDYKPNSSCNSPSKDMKNSLPVAGGGVVGTNSLSYGGQMPVLPVRNNLRRPNSSHFPPAASRFHFRKGLASRCTWKCTAIALIVLCVILTAALSYISASSLLNWSYQSAKPCSVLVGDNTQIIPASKTAPSETNHSTSSRPKPPSSATSSSSGGKSIEPLYARKRRDVSSPHAVFFPNITTTSSSVSNFSSEHVGSLHVSTEGPGGSMLHEAESSTQVFVVSTNSPTVSESEDEISTVEGETTTDGVKTETLLPTTEDELHELYGELSNEESSDAALFEGEVMDAKAVDVDVAEVNETVVKSGELQHDSPILLYEKPASGEEKRKLADSSKELTGANLAEPPERDAPAPGLKNVYIQQGKSEASQTPVTEPTVKVFEIPAASSEATPSKRVQVNVTISTDPDPQNPHQTHSIYVLSVSVPTDGHEPGVELNTKEGASFSDIHEANKANPQPVESPHGGACECECPCLDGSRELLDFNSSNYDYDWLFSSKEYGFSKRKPDFTVSSTESTGTSEVWTTNCPEVTTKLPPPPTILVLEGARTFPAQSFPPDGTTFSQTSLGKRLTQEIPPYGYWNMQFYHPEAAYVKFEYTIPRGASIGVYARRNALPTHTQYDILEVLSGFKARTTRAAHSIVKKEVTHYMEQGHWFLSLYNDDGDAQEITLEAEVADDMTHNCPNGCSGKGECLMGHCQCNPGFGGDDCSETDCPHPTCSGHGYCLEGSCICKKGWKGADCAQMDKEALQCLPDCSGHGSFDLDSQTCTCEPRWSGDDCSKELCDLDCGNHGHCVSEACQCSRGWSGEYCNLKQCDPRCNEHGQCKNGTCLCVTGWNGKHCTIEGCPNSCSAHGQCRFNGDGMWECRCENGWDGPDCSILLEQNCNDGRDNDKDGLSDCEDPECCSSAACKSSQLCVSSPKPIDILLRKQPPAITASFFERMKFLIDEGSLQNYARQETFNESRSAVVRGRVVTQMGTGLMGVRVSTSTPLEGFTLTRDDGWFDLLVNGGGAVTLQFGRSPFRPQSDIVFIPWNEVVIIDNVVMSLGEEKAVSVIPQPCVPHDYDIMKPVVLATWKHGFQGACPEKSAILAESQVVQESLGIPGTGLHLVYHSSRAAGYLSTIQLQLTPEIVPTTLKLIHLRITIEGILFEKVFEADPVIKFTYAWNRLNVYRQRVYGVTTAIVKVGYQYSNCKDVIWDVQTTKLSGHDMSISDVGGWNLDIHHRYNFHEGILQKGDGSNIYLKHKPRVILTTMGDGHQRPLDCMDCEGQATKQRLLAPVALASDRDGSIYVGDFNLIRKIQTDGTVRTLVRLNATTVSYRYHLALSSMDGNLYVSDPESHRIIKVRSTDDFSDPDYNWETVVGSGERCLPGDEAHCGDGALARDAKLAYPKGIAVSYDNVLYIADGTNIRMVDRDGIVTTVIGNHMHKSHWKPLPCEGTLNIEEVHLRWPTELAINPLDNTLHIIDDHMILQLTTDGRIKVIAGRPLHCASSLYSYDMDLATHATLVMPQSIAFSSSGDLYVAESDSQRINRVRVIGTDGKIAQYAGAESKCNCLERGCDCFEADHYLASNSKFNSISAVSVSPDGHVHIGDQSNYRIRSVMASIPDSSISREYEIYSPETQEIYIFNRFGQHIATKNILTGETSYLFTYNVNTSNGKLSTVTDAAGNKVFLLRDYSSQVNSIENTKGQKCRLKMSRMRMLHELSTPDNYNVTFDYHGPTGLLKTKIDSSGRSYVYNYDEFGRLTTAVTPTGKVISLSFDLSVIGATVKVSENDEKHLSMLIKGSSVSTKVEDLRNKIMMYPDGGVASFRAWTHSITTDTVPYNILADKGPLLAESYPIPSKQHTEIGGDLANRFEWRYYIRPNSNSKGNKNIPRAIAKVGKKLRVNGENILTMEYDRETASISVFMDDKAELLNVSYDRSSRPIRFGPKNGLFAEVELEYDRFSRLSNWKWGDLSESYGFDRAGRLSEIKYADGSSLQYAFKDMFSSLPLKVTTPRGSDYLLQYDDSGALQSLTTPRGHIHTFSLQTSLGFFKYQYFSPMNRHPYEIMYNDDGQILSKIFPHQSSRVTYIYDSSGRLETSIAGMTATHYAYNEVGLVRDVEVIEPNMELRQEFRYQSGVVKDERLKFNVKSGLDNTRYKYQYDGNNRISSIDVDINGKELPQLKVKYNQNIGVLETISDLRIYRNTFNRSVMQDTGKQFFSITDHDDHGRLKSVLINIKSFDVFRLELEYDFRNRIKLQKLLVGRTQFMDRISYNSDGHVLEVIGSSNWKYVYDENGNIQATIKEKEKTTLGYDSGDRVVQYGDVEFNSYDNSGFVVRRGEQKYRFNPKGQLIHAFEADKFQTWYYYDGQDRLIAWNDDKGNVTQYLYSNPSTPELITHLYFPKTGRTFRFLYDTRDVLITVETLEQRFYVAADQNGSPLALFDINGNLIKEIRRTPFGNIVLDTNPDFYLPVDFHGGIYDLNTKLVYINKRFYDPIVGQWVIPAWEKLASKLTTPTDIFIYRFLNNDPINAKYTTNYMTDEKSWLQLYGYDIQKMLGSEYIGKIVYNPTAIVSAPQLAPDFGIMSGLQCMVDQVNEKFADISFVPKPLLKKEPKTRNLLPRVAYRKSVFGEGVLISRVGSRALVSVVEGVNGVVQDVVTSVFNNSFFLNLQFSIHDQDFFYFVKDNVLKIRDDLEELRRLGGMFNVSTHEITEHGSATPLKELRLHNLDAVVIIKYGADPDQETRKILRHANKRAIERAWELEKQLIAAGFQGRGNWTEEEKEELVSHGDVDGYEGIDLRSIHKYPQLADDPGNVFFQRDSKRKRRKSGTRRGRIHRHDS
uniref:EGF-like domain-containing protein n=1 Tax=Dendroctonus ponderosae TaxID=77166 RepID=A0AAR5Q7H5_DENPD